MKEFENDILKMNKLEDRLLFQQTADTLTQLTVMMN